MFQNPEQAVEVELPLDLTQAPTPADYASWQCELNRQKLCNVVILVYYLLILEGALRKWIAPSFEKELFFVRDPLLLYIYVFSLLNGFWPKASVLFWCGLTLAMIGFNLMIWHLDDTSLTLMAYGWRNYFAYVPLAFIIGEQFRHREWLRVVRFTVLLSIPIAMLCVLQSVSSPTAPINAGFGATSDELFVPLGVGEKVIRSCGLFTSGTGQVQFIGSLAAILLWMWSDTEVRYMFGRWALPAATVATIVMLVVGGHRAAFVLVGVVAAGGAAISGPARGARSSMRLVVGILLLAGLVFFFGKYLFQEQSRALVERSNGAAEGDSVYSYGLVNRALADFTRFIEYIPNTGYAGSGLGIAGNAGDILVGTNSVEDDWSRNIVELGPIVGLMFIAYRIAFVLVLVFGAARACRLYNDQLPGLLVGFVGITLLYGQMTGQGSVNGYTWLFAGFSLAANTNHLSRQHR